ncbi:hypothetical protein Dsin_011284 [Dipteronia sinensis]|uniref:Zinc finger CCCH domain-containing protein 44 n=1 Tax=Dipteronia sinensis TaxID=43782 RepID=A0AAE0EDN0_9ROSI|nr:hypothetical protein Dsin_011284 [Dipteronia sinensis]
MEQQQHHYREQQQQQQQQLFQELERESSFYKPSLQEEVPSKQNFDDGLREIQLSSVDHCDDVRGPADSQPAGAPDYAVVKDADVAVRGASTVMVDVEVKVVEKAKRKRGRPPRVQAATAAATGHPPPRPQLRKQTDEEEDVCFICFDGGSLVLCDRKGCPKAYHPSCIKRDEAFFQSKAKWNCGWHICSSCQKASHYLCYTCTYSWCKGCTKDADFVCVRGNKGFCGICMRTIMLIENITIEDQEKVQVDFDDTSSWEYLFKVYWIYLKGKISLTLDELTQAKNPWKPPAVMASKRESSGQLYDFNYNKRSSSENVGGYSEINHAKRRKTKQRLEFSNKMNSPSMEKSNVDKGKHLPEGEKWATNELLELVTHMKHGDTSVMSLFDVQALLLEYIKKNNLRDPRRKSEIICDVRLSNLFGKERVGHFEMLKLLEYHFLSQEKSSAVPCITGVIDTVASQVETNANNDNQPIVGDDKRRKTRKKADNKGAQANLDEYAAIDAHNINLIYLKRSSMESLISEADNVHDKVVGSMVRIKIPGSDQKQDMYRLVQVIGTSKATEPYKIGERATDVMLEISNLNKKEVVSMDGISNQEFSEEECKRLRQCIKFGLIKRFTVGEIQEKAVTLQALRVNELLESEILRLNHLRDRANEKGHRKELRECVEKLQLLKSPEERKRRLVEIPEVHTDPNMDPNYKSEDDAGEFDEKKRVKTLRPRNPSFGGNEREPISARKVGDTSSDLASRAQINSTTTLERSTNMSNTFYVDREGTTRILEGVNESPQKQEKESFGLVNNSAVGRSESLSGVALGESPPSNSAGMAQSVTNFEAEKMWHYQDPTGKIQGPFAMVQLRKWSELHFPPDLRVWMIDQQQGDSILLTDALNGQFPKGPLLHNSCLLPQDVRSISDDRCKTSDGECSESINTTHEDNKRVDDTTHEDNKKVYGSLNSMQIDDSAKSESNDEAVKVNGLVSHSSNLTKPAAVNSNEGQIENILPGGDSLKGNHSWSEQRPECNLFPSPAPSEKQCETVSHQVKENRGGEMWKSDGLNEGSHKTTEGQINVGLGSDKQVDSEGNSGQSSGQNWRPPPLDSSSNNWDSNSSFVALAKSLGLSDENQDIDFSDLPSPTPPKPSHGDLKGQDAEVKQSVSSDAPMQDSGPSWSTASSPAGAGPHLPDVAGEWGRYSPTPANPSVEEWDSDLLPPSSLRPTEMASDHAATPTSGNCQLTHTSPSHPASNAAWRAIIVVTEPDEFTPLAADESVSDLLAEVEAMESLNRLASSPTSALRCGVELAQGSENDCFSPVDGFSPTPDPGKSDAMSSSSDLQLHSQSTVTDEQLVVSQADVLKPLKSSVRHSSTSAEAGKDGRPSDDSVNQCEAGSNHQRPLPPVTSLNMAAPNTTWRVESETTNNSRGVVQGSGNFGLGGLARGNADWGIGQWTGPEHTGMNSSSTSVGNPSPWGSQPRYGGDRYSNQRVYDSHGREVFSRDKGRPALNRQTLHSVGNGGGSYRPMPKGQRICKFYENGFCKKGASCTYRHP